MHPLLSSTSGIVFLNHCYAYIFKFFSISATVSYKARLVNLQLVDTTGQEDFGIFRFSLPFPLSLPPLPPSSSRTLPFSHDTAQPLWDRSATHRHMCSYWCSLYIILWASRKPSGTGCKRFENTLLECLVSFSSRSLPSFLRYLFPSPHVLSILVPSLCCLSLLLVFLLLDYFFW